MSNTFNDKFYGIKESKKSIKEIKQVDEDEEAKEIETKYNLEGSLSYDDQNQQNTIQNTEEPLENDEEIAGKVDDKLIDNIEDNSPDYDMVDPKNWDDIPAKSHIKYLRKDGKKVTGFLLNRKTTKKGSHRW